MNYPIINPVATGARIKELREQNHLQVSDVIWDYRPAVEKGKY